jgi:Zn-finger nucleic acid-binding protein
MSEAQSMHCPNCGSAVDPDLNRCPYCHARLATVSCPSCFALMFDGAAFCPKCGHRRARAEAEDASVRCPGCRNEMQRIDLGGTPLMECQACDGVWVEAEVFEKICIDRAAQAAVLHRFTRERQPGVERVKYRPCASCGKMMNRVNFGRMSGTVVDVCRGHGTFLDAGELHQIVEFIHGGGLERARERQIEDLREQERRLEAREHQISRDWASVEPYAPLAHKVGRLSADAIFELLSAIVDKKG